MKSTHYQIVSTFNDLQKVFFVRGVVFVEEQNCSYHEDFDGKDFSAIHFLGTIENEPAAAARMRFCKDYVKIERLAVRKKFRGKGIGKELFSFIINHIKELGYTRIVIHAQAHLLNYYESFGFVKQGEKFVEANIEHYHMEIKINP